MNRLLLLIVMLLGCISSATADHITGGEVFYRYTGTSGNGMNEYDVTIRIFMRCNSGRQFNNPAAIAIFHKNTSVKLSDYSVFLSRRETLSERSSDPCINNPPLVCYEVG